MDLNRPHMSQKSSQMDLNRTLMNQKRSQRHYRPLMDLKRSHMASKRRQMDLIRSHMDLKRPLMRAHCEKKTGSIFLKRGNSNSLHGEDHSGQF